MSEFNQPHLRPKTPLQQFVADVSRAAGVSEDFMEASDHAYGCRCEKCLDWWRTMAVCEDGHWETGAFTVEELWPDGVIPGKHFVDYGEESDASDD